MEKRAIKEEKQRDEALGKVTQQRHRIYAPETALEEEKGRNLKLKAQLNRDYENSSIPSSKTLHHKKISNSREKSGRKPGAQPGHPGHGRKKQIPTMEAVLLPPPLAERLLRRYKRKQQQAVSFRGFESIEYLCQCMSMLIQIRQNEESNLYNRVSQIFG